MGGPAATRAATRPRAGGGFGGGGPRRRINDNGDDWLLHVMQAIDDHKWSYTAWDFHTHAGPTLVSDWDYQPTPDFGVYVKAMLEGKLPKYTPPARPTTQPAADANAQPAATPPPPPATATAMRSPNSRPASPPPTPPANSASPTS